MSERLLGELIDRLDKLIRHIETRQEGKADRIIRSSELAAYAGLKRTQISALIERGEFPAPVPLSDGGRAVGFLESEIAKWQRARIAARDTKGIR